MSGIHVISGCKNKISHLKNRPISKASLKILGKENRVKRPASGQSGLPPQSIRAGLVVTVLLNPRKNQEMNIHSVAALGQ